MTKSALNFGVVLTIPSVKVTARNRVLKKMVISTVSESGWNSIYPRTSLICLGSSLRGTGCNDPLNFVRRSALSAKSLAFMLAPSSFLLSSGSAPSGYPAPLLHSLVSRSVHREQGAGEESAVLLL